MQQFQDEAVMRPEIDHRWSSHVVNSTDDSEKHDSLPSLVLGLRLRGYLTQDERSQLDRLALSEQKVFLVRGDRVLHPADGTPFPLEHVAATPGQDTVALFSHRYHVDQGDHGHAYKIQTAVLNPGQPDAFLFGWFGPEPDPLERGPDNRFSDTVEQLRQAFTNSTELTSRMSKLLDEPVPTLILDRRTERVLMCNTAAVELMKLDQTTTIGHPFEQIRSHLGRLPAGRRMTMRHMASATPELTIITLDETTITNRDDHRFYADFLLHPARQKLSSIITAAKLLQTDASDLGAEEVSRLSRLIAGEGRYLDDLVNKQLLLVEGVSTVTSSGSMVTQIELAADRVSAILGQPCNTEILNNCANSAPRASRPSFALLTEAVLRGHRGDPNSQQPTVVTIEPDGSTTGVVVRFETEMSGTAAIGDDIDLMLDYARRLATRLGYREFNSSFISNHRIRTEMILNTDQITEDI
jgi:hypothetical protein